MHEKKSKINLCMYLKQRLKIHKVKLTRLKKESTVQQLCLDLNILL